MNDVGGSAKPRARRLLPREAFEQTQALRSALAEGEVMRLHLDPLYAAERVLASIARTVSLTEPCRRSLLDTDPACFSPLEPLALALQHAQRSTRTGKRTVSPVRDTSAALVTMRSKLWSCASLMSKTGQLHDRWQAGIPNSNGYKNQFTSVLALAGLLRAHWQAFDGKLPITLDDLDEAENLVAELVQRLADRQRTKAPSAAIIERDRAFTLFYRCYREVLRAVGYLRFYQGDADSYLPDIHTPKKRQKAVKRATRRDGSRRPRPDRSPPSVPDPRSTDR